MTHIHHSDDPRWREPHLIERVIVQLADGFDDKKYCELLKKHGAHERKHIVEIGRRVIVCEPDKIEPLLDALEDAGLLVSSEPDGMLHAGSDVEFGELEAVAPNDPFIGRQWHLKAAGILDAWAITQGSKNVTLAIIDSGAYAHPDLTNAVAGYNFVDYSNNTRDTGALGGHGTATAGTAGATSNNGIGVAGVAQVKVMPLVVLSSTNYAAWSDVGDAIVYAANHGARVLNISIGGTSPSSTLDSACNYAWSKGCTIFASAMNSHNTVPNYPAACGGVMAIAATAPTGALASFSNRGPWVNLAAPGQSIYTTYKLASYANWSGTSFASPICAGVACLMIAARPTITNTEICLLMKQTADDIVGQPFGRVNALRAVQAAKGA